MHILAKAASGIVLTACMATSVYAADLVLSDPVSMPQSDSAFRFEGLYVGLTAGYARTYSGGEGSYGTIGIVAGANVAISDSVLLGAEFQLNQGYYDGVFDGSEWLALAHVGFVPVDGLQVYAAAGAGRFNQVYNTVALGVGAEYALTDMMSVRGEGLALFRPGYEDREVKANVGVLFHF
jgi:opacity protein-like surface antigen